MNIESLYWNDCNPELRSSCADLWAIVWPPGRSSVEREQKYEGLREHEVHIARVDGEVFAIARTFNQTILMGDSPRDVIALASVCSHPEHRGEGYGKAVALAALARSSAVAPALFQTGVPSFYERLGGRVINNSISTSTVGVEAFTDDRIMIHPKDAPWDEAAAVDLTVAGW